MSGVVIPGPRAAGRAAAGRPSWTALRARARHVAQAAVTPLELDDVLDVFHPLRRGAELRARIVEVRAETADAATIVLQPGRDWAGHVPGQYVRVGVDVEGVRLWRTYSLTHDARADRRLSITVKAIPGGVVSTHLVRHARPGQMIQLAQAEGDFVLPSPMPEKLLLLTAGSGITPVIGMLRNLFSRQQPPACDITLVHVNAEESASIFRAELQALDARGAIRLVERFDDAHGLLDVDELATLVPDLAERTAYACGPAGLLDALETYYAEAGLALATERFRPPALAEPGEGGTVAFTGTAGGPVGAVVEADGATPILDAAEQAGVLMPSGCRMGICMGCVLPMTSGAVRDLRNGALTTAVPGETDPGGVPIQTCISAAAGACEIRH